MYTEDVYTMLQESGLPSSYYVVEGERPKPPFLMFFYAAGRDVYADGVNYATVDELHVLRCASEVDLRADRAIGRLLNDHNLTCRWERWYDPKEKLWVTEFVAEVNIEEGEET